jgi:hypothetical protein
MSNSIRIKRRASTGSAGAPTSLKNGELAYNEADDVLYYGYGVSGSNAAQIKPIAGNLPATTLSNYVNRTTAQSVAGVKTLTSLLKPNGGIGVNGDKFTVASSTGNTVIAGTLNGHTIPSGSAGTFALTTDTLATHSGHSYIDISGQDIVASDVALGSHTSGNYVESLAEYSTNPGISLAGDTPTEGNTITISVDSTVIRNFGAQNVGGVKTFTSLINADAGIAVDTDKFTVADTTGNTVIGGTLGVTGVTTLTGALNANGGIAVDTNKFTVADGTGNIYTAGTLAVAGTTDLVGQTNVANLQIDGNIAFAGSTIQFDALPAASTAQTKFLVLDTTSGVHSLKTRTAALTRSDIGLAATADVTFANVTASGSGGFSGSGANLTSLASAALPVATATAKGAIELFSGTAQSVAANTVTTTAGRTYGIQLNSAGQAVVNVPWAQATRDSLGIDTDDNVTLGTLAVGNITTTGYLRGPGNFTIDPAAHGDATGTLTVEGNLVVNGSTTTVSSTTIEIADKDLQLAKNTGLAQLTGAGLLLGQGSGGAEVSFIFEYNSGSNQQMVLSTGLKANGGLKNTVLTSCTIDGGTF